VDAIWYLLGFEIQCISMAIVMQATRYAMVMYPSEESATYFKMPCLYGAKNCRGFIAEDNWQRPECGVGWNLRFVI
jgi:hypothetical protein